MSIREPESTWWATQNAWAEHESAMTVAMVNQYDAGRDPEPVVSRLAELAVDDELLVVYVSEPPSRPEHHAMLEGLRDRLPRHDVVEMFVSQHNAEMRRTAAKTLERFLDAGSLPVVVTPARQVRDLTAEISIYLHADRVLRVSCTEAGAELHQVWRRREPAVSVN